MDRDVTVWFFEVTDKDGGEPLEAVIRRIGNIDPIQNRERDAGEGIVLRLEHLQEDGDLLLGDLTRIQTQNLPGQVMENSTDPLPFERLGHSVAFCYDTAANAIAIQFNMSARAGRVLHYFSRFSEPSQFGYLPLLRELSLAEFGRKRTKKLAIHVSRIRDFANAQNQQADFETALEEMAGMFEAPSIKIEVATRIDGRPLNQNQIMGTIRRLLRIRQETNAVRAIKAYTYEDEAPYNFINDLIKEKETLPLPDNSPNEGRAVRLAFVQRAYENNRAHIRRILGVE